MDDILKLMLQFAVAPLGAFVIWTYKKHQMKVERLEQRIASVETSTAVIQVMVDSIHEDIREIKRSIEKLVDRSS